MAKLAQSEFNAGSISDNSVKGDVEFTNNFNKKACYKTYFKSLSICILLSCN